MTTLVSRQIIPRRISAVPELSADRRAGRRGTDPPPPSASIFAQFAFGSTGLPFSDHRLENHQLRRLTSLTRTSSPGNNRNSFGSRTAWLRPRTKIFAIGAMCFSRRAAYLSAIDIMRKALPSIPRGAAEAAGQTRTSAPVIVTSRLPETHYDDAIAEPAAVLQILAVEPVAAGLDRGGDDERVVDVEAVVPGERNGDLVGRYPTGLTSSTSARNSSSQPPRSPNRA